jgi:hypothetical protein
VVGTGSLNTETRSEAFGTKAVTNENVNPVLQNQDEASPPLCVLNILGGLDSEHHLVQELAGRF